MPVNLAAIPRELVESTLFGHEKGSFTGAHRQQLGKFELAAGGTLFLDEIGDLRMDLQAKLLRAIQEGEIERIGGAKPIKTDFRLIAATNVDLESAVKEGTLPRGSVLPRQRHPAAGCRRCANALDDLPELARFFLRRYNTKVPEGSAGHRRFDDRRALELLVAWQHSGAREPDRAHRRHRPTRHGSPTRTCRSTSISQSSPRQRHRAAKACSSRPPTPSNATSSCGRSRNADGTSRPRPVIWGFR